MFPFKYVSNLNIFLGGTTETNGTNSNETTYIIIIATLAAVLLLVSIGITFFCYKKKTKRTITNDPEEETPMTNVTSSPKKVNIAGILKGEVDLPEQVEFGRLFEYEDKIESRLSTYQGKRNNKNDGFNLNPQILPFDHNRVKLRNPIDGNDYVNASKLSQPSDNDPTYDQILYTDYVPFFKIGFFVGQDPTPNTLRHYHQIIHENLINVVVRLTSEPSTIPLQEGKVTHFRDLTRKVVKRSQLMENLVSTRYELFDVSSPDAQYMHKVHFFEILNFPREGVSSIEETNSLLSALCLIRNLLKQKNNSLKLLVHDDEAGVSGGAVFVALYDLLQKIDENVNENHQPKKSAEALSIFQVVDGLRKDRVMMVNTFHIYKLLYFCLSQYGKNKEHFDNLKPKPSATTSQRRVAEAGQTNASRPRRVVRRKDEPEDIFDSYSLSSEDSVQYVMS